MRIYVHYESQLAKSIEVPPSVVLQLDFDYFETGARIGPYFLIVCFDYLLHGINGLVLVSDLLVTEKMNLV